MTTSSCGSPACGCGGSAAPAVDDAVARINGIALHAPGEQLPDELLRQRACTELLRQQAQREGLLAADDAPGLDGATSEAAADAIERLLDTALELPEPTDAAGRRHYAAHAGRYAIGEKVRARHVLFAVTPGVDVQQLRQRAEACLLDVRNTTPQEQAAGDRFAAAAKSTSNCPSGAQGGDLGWLTAQDCAPEFARELFGQAEVGVLPRLVHSRFGLHVVEVLERAAGTTPPYEQVRATVLATLRQQSFATALSQYLQLLAGQAQMHGVELEGAETPLVQ